MSRKNIPNIIDCHSNFNKFHIFGPVSPNSQWIIQFDCHAAACLPDDF